MYGQQPILVLSKCLLIYPFKFLVKLAIYLFVESPFQVKIQNVSPAGRFRSKILTLERWICSQSCLKLSFSLWITNFSEYSMYFVFVLDYSGRYSNMPWTSGYVENVDGPDGRYRDDEWRQRYSSWDHSPTPGREIHDWNCQNSRWRG